MRTALLPAGPDPYLLAYWLRNYATWADVVDSLDIVVCGQNDPEVRAYITELVAAAPHASVMFLRKFTDHGLVLDLLIRECEGELVVLCEDDAFVQRPAVMRECFEQLHDVDIVGTPRQYGHGQLFDRTAELYGLRGAFSPAFLFARRPYLDAVVPECGSAGRFTSARWEPGSTIKALDLTVGNVALSVDTFGAATFQLLAMGLRFDTREAFRAEQALSDGHWFHVGSLSDGYGRSFLGTDTWHKRMVDAAIHDPRDWYKRVAWWSRVWACNPDDSKHHRRYGEALQDFVRAAGLSPSLIGRAADAIPPLVTWAER